MNNHFYYDTTKWLFWLTVLCAVLSGVFALYVFLASARHPSKIYWSTTAVTIGQLMTYSYLAYFIWNNFRFFRIPVEFVAILAVVGLSKIVLWVALIIETKRPPQYNRRVADSVLTHTRRVTDNPLTDPPE
jgi:hypothetical protein